jgi:hypothetical protein
MDICSVVGLAHRKQHHAPRLAKQSFTFMHSSRYPLAPDALRLEHGDRWSAGHLARPKLSQLRQLRQTQAKIKVLVTRVNNITKTGNAFANLQHLYPIRKEPSYSYC